MACSPLGRRSNCGRQQALLVTTNYRAWASSYARATPPFGCTAEPFLCTIMKTPSLQFPGNGNACARIVTALLAACVVATTDATAQSEASSSASFGIYPVNAGVLGAPIYERSIIANWPSTQPIAPAPVMLDFNNFPQGGITLPPGNYAFRVELHSSADWQGASGGLLGFGNRALSGWADVQILFNNVAITQTDTAVIGTLRDLDRVCAAAPRPLSGPCGPGGVSLPLGTQTGLFPVTQTAGNLLETGSGTSDARYQALSIGGGLGAELLGTATSETWGRNAPFQNPLPPFQTWVPNASSGASLLQHLVVWLPFGAGLDVEGSVETGQPGASQRNPRFPNGGPWLFELAQTGWWFDPPLAQGYDFTMQNTSRFTRIMTLPVGIDGDGLFEVLVGNQSLGQFAEGSSVDFTQLVDPAGVAAFRLVGIDPTVDSTDQAAFPIQLEFNTPTADFTMVPVKVHTVAASCMPATSCPACTALELDTQGDALLGNTGFAIDLSGGPTGGIGLVYASIGHCQSVPFECGTLVLDPSSAIDLGFALLGGVGSCGGSGTFSMPLPNLPALFGTFLCAQGAVLCPAGGLGLTHGIQFPIGS